jgi:uncharacterized membrane protein (DUF4010 family)
LWQPQCALVGDLVGSIALVIFLIYLAVQVGQNTRGIQTAAHQHIVSANAAITMTPAQNLDLASALAKGAVSSKNLSDKN